MKYRIKPVRGLKWKVQYKTGLFWWTVKEPGYEMDCPVHFDTRNAAVQWIANDMHRRIAERAHLASPMEVYP